MCSIHWKSHIYLSIIFIVFAIQPPLFNSNTNDFNPYDVLGLKKSATDKEIRAAYKKLAKYWHPDKNSEANAHDQFTKINAAYEILSDSEKKSNYDQYGTTSNDNSQRGSYGFRDPYDMFRSQFGNFYFFSDTPHGSKKTINARELINDILPNSHIKPYILFGSTNFCIRCQQPASIFRSMQKQFDDVGIGTGEFNIRDRWVSNELGIIDNPCLVGISQNKVYHFDENDYSETHIKEFVRKIIPVNYYVRTLHTIDDIYNYISTCNQTNKVHTILLTRHKFPTLKYF
ncbi:unnamed protein product, partial [Didymodactylos carnosus]